MSNETINLIPNALASGETYVNTEDKRAVMRQSLSDTYNNKPRSLLVELITNALDAQAVAGVNDPIEVSLDEDNNLTVTDHGCGMTAEFLTKKFVGFNVSGWRDDERTNGSYGIGAFVPLSVADAYTVTSTKDGRTAELMVMSTTTSMPWVLVRDEETPHEPNGTTVAVNVGETYARRNYYDRHIRGTSVILDHLTQIVAQNPGVEIIFNGEAVDSKTTVLAQYPDLKATVLLTHKPVAYNTIVRMRRNTYPIDLYGKPDKYGESGTVIVLFDLEPGEMTTTNSREQLQSSPENDARKAELSKAYDEVIKRWLSENHDADDDVQTFLGKLDALDVPLYIATGYSADSIEPIKSDVSVYDHCIEDIAIKQWSGGPLEHTDRAHLKSARTTKVVYDVPQETSRATIMRHLRAWDDANTDGTTHYVMTSLVSGDVAWHRIGGEGTIDWAEVRRAGLDAQREQRAYTKETAPVVQMPVNIETNMGLMSIEEIVATDKPIVRMTREAQLHRGERPWLEIVTTKRVIKGTALKNVEIVDWKDSVNQILAMNPIPAKLGKLINIVHLANLSTYAPLRELLKIADRAEEIKDPTLRAYLRLGQRHNLAQILAPLRGKPVYDSNLARPEEFKWVNDTSVGCHYGPRLDILVYEDHYRMAHAAKISSQRDADELIAYLNMAYKLNRKDSQRLRIVTPSDTQEG